MEIYSGSGDGFRNLLLLEVSYLMKLTTMGANTTKKGGENVTSNLSMQGQTDHDR